ncbi:MAG: hypothetical protein WAW86_04845 [Gammaproteobacteria bacterium]
MPNLFMNINNLIGNAGSQLRLSSKFSALNFTSSNSGFVDDPLTFSQFYQFSTLNNGSKIILLAPAVYNITTNQLTINGVIVPIAGFNYLDFSGNILFIAPPPPIPEGFIARILSPYTQLPTVNDHGLQSVSITNNVSGKLSNLREILNNLNLSSNTEELSVIAFELRTNLNNILGILRLMSENNARDIGEEQKDYIKDIIDESNRVIEAIPEL